MTQDGSATPDQIRAQEKRDAGQARADAADAASREQVEAASRTAPEGRQAPPMETAAPASSRKPAKKAAKKA